MEGNKIVVVGAGPAGMMAAIRAAELGADVTLIEKNNILGKKLLLSGKGRCNLTNTADLDAYFRKFSAKAEFLRDSFAKFFHTELMKFFEDRGLKFKVERQQRVFPITDSSASVERVLEKELERLKVKILRKTRLNNIVTLHGAVTGVTVDSERFIPADRVILATGGVSFPLTGSTGEGLDIAAKLGHNIIELRPGLMALKVKQNYPALLEGLTLKNIRIIFSDGKKRLVSEVGELLFTAKGISGPLVFTSSAKVGDWLKEGKIVFAEIDLKPGLSPQQLEARLIREFETNPGKALKNILKELLPLRLIDIFVRLAKIDAAKKANQVTSAERKLMVGIMKSFRLDISGSVGFEDAMVTRGGVSLKQINPRTMESRLIKGLYFAGEMIDVDADTGGFNLQAAFSTGFLAGESASQ